MVSAPKPHSSTPASLRLALGLLSSYLFFLLRRPISGSNVHYLEQRLRGFRSLVPLIETGDAPPLRAVARSLRRLQVANFVQTARDLQFRLLPLVSDASVPPDFIVSVDRPSISPFEGAGKIVIITGPAIGIGDEIILFPLPSLIKSANAGAEISVVSGYAGLWKGVEGVCDVLHYRTHSELLEALRADGALVLLADFEKPGLVPLMAAEPANSTYVELSLGGQYAAVVNRNSRHVWTVNAPLDARLNYYEAFQWLTEWIGLTPTLQGRYHGAVRQSAGPSSGALRIFVSPFTSKYDPSPIYWSRILASMFSSSPGCAVEFVLDPGASFSTERFATAVLASASVRAVPGVSFSIARDCGARTLSLAGAFSEMERAHAVLCADSFAAHAAPHYGCTTLVIARVGLENWRTPWPKSFYFDLEQPVDEMVTAMREVLFAAHGGMLDRAQPSFSFEAMAARLHVHAREFKAALELSCPVRPEQINAARRRFLESQRALIETVPSWPPDLRGLLHDESLARTWRELNHSETDLRGREVIDHLRLELRRWELTNVCRFASLVSNGVAAGAALGEAG